MKELLFIYTALLHECEQEATGFVDVAHNGRQVAAVEAEQSTAAVNPFINWKQAETEIPSAK